MTLEEMQIALLDLQEKQKITNAENETLKTQMEEKNKREKELEETNQKLYVKLTTNVEEDESKKDVIPKYLDEKTFKDLDKHELRLLKELEEEE